MHLQNTVDKTLLRRHFYVALPVACLLMLVLDGYRLLKKGSFLDTLLPFAALFLAFFLAELTR